MFGSEQENVPGQQADHVGVTFIAVLQYFVSLPLRFKLYKIELRVHELLNSQNKGSEGLNFNLVQLSFVIVTVTVAAISFRDGWH